MKFSEANAKIKALRQVPSLAKFLTKRKVYSFDLLSGWSCPYAKDCLSKVVVANGKRSIKDGPETQFRCFSASQEVLFTNLYNLRKHNFDSLRGLDSVEIVRKLHPTLPKNAGVVRIHVGGEFFNMPYMLAWATIAEIESDRLFYAYTKSLPYWVSLKNYIDSLPNFILTASRGGRRDDLIDSENLREARVVFTESEADTLGYEIDHDDSHAADPSKQTESFALLLHGVQPAGSDAADALKNLKGKGSYKR